MRDLTKTMEIATKEAEEEAETNASEPAGQSSIKPDVKSPTLETSQPTAQATTLHAASASREPISNTLPTVQTPDPPARTLAGSGRSTPRHGIPIRPAIMDKSDDDARLDAVGLSEEEKRKERKKAGMSKEQREEFAAFEKERRRVRDERVDTLAKKLIDRISIWTETDKSSDVTKAFEGKVRLEVENLKMESFGLEILHAIGTTYLQKATSFLKSQKFLGISGFFSRLKDKGTLAKETWSTVSTALDAQRTMEEMARMEERGGEDWTDEKKAEYEKRVTGKVLAAAWKGSKFEIQSVLRDVCDKVLNDKNVPFSKRVERARALVIAGTIYLNVGFIIDQ